MNGYIRTVITIITLALLFLACAAGGTDRRSRNIEELKSLDPALLTDEEKLELHLTEALDKAERYISLGQFSEALSIVQSIINDHHNTVYSDKAYFMKGSIYVNMLNFRRDPDKAAAAFRMVIASEPETEFDKKALGALDRIKK